MRERREPTRVVRVKESTHRLLKAASALVGQSMQDFIEQAVMPKESGGEPQQGDGGGGAEPR
jgi:uncharacterized protein (DUF1778 family)